MNHNTGMLRSASNQMEKQQMQQLREIREAQILSNSIPARILSQKQVKYFSVASTMKKPKPHRLEKLPVKR